MLYMYKIIGILSVNIQITNNKFPIIIFMYMIIQFQIHMVENPYAAYWRKCCVLGILNATCVHIVVKNKHIWAYIMVSTGW